MSFKRQFVLIIVIVLLGMFAISPVFSQNAAKGIMSFYRDVFEQDEKNLYDYLIDELLNYIQDHPDSTDTAEALLLLSKSYQNRGKEYEALAASLELLYLFPGAANRQECLNFATSIITTERSFDADEAKYTALVNETVAGISRADRFYEYLGMLIKLDEKDLYDWTINAARSYCSQFPNDGRLDNVQKWIGDIYLEKGDEWQASMSYLKLDYTHPNSPLLPETRYLRSKILYEELREYELAVQSLEQIAATWPTHEYAAASLFMIGEIYENKLKDYDKAILYYRKLVDMFPQYPKSVNALLSIGEINAKRLDKYPEAIAAYNEFVEKYRSNPQGVEALLRVAELYEDEVKDYTQAAAYYAQVAEIYPTYDDAPDCLIKAGEISEDKLGDYKQAVIYYQMVLNTFPDHKKAKDAKKKLDKAQENLPAGTF